MMNSVAARVTSVLGGFHPLMAGALIAAIVSCGRTEPLNHLNGHAAETGAGPSAASGVGGGGEGGTCAHTEEFCDGHDDDCNGVVDDGNPGGGALCNTGAIGECAAGFTACVQGQLECVGVSPSTEICDGLDNDCDGRVDDDPADARGQCDTGMDGNCLPGIYSCTQAIITCLPVNAPRGESCDALDNDCNGIVDDSDDCVRRVFVTSQAYSGDLGGLAGADAICQLHATTAGLYGTFKAWISDESQSASSRLAHSAAPYVLVDGVTVVAHGWSELTSGGLKHAIEVNEFGGPPPEVTLGCGATAAWVWTGTSSGGQLFAPGQTCAGWTGDSAALLLAGDAHSSDAAWTQKCSGGPPEPNCTQTAALYCIEQ